MNYKFVERILGEGLNPLKSFSKPYKVSTDFNYYRIFI